MHYNVGGSSKFYGAAMFRLRERDFQELDHREGLSPAWPIQYADLAPYYDQAESMFFVHGDESGDPTAPPRARPYPFPAIPSEPVVEGLIKRLRALKLSPTPMPLALKSGMEGGCILCSTCDGFPCRLGQKGDAETCAIEPALATGRVQLLRRAFARRLVLSPDGRRVDAVEVEHGGEIKRFSAQFVVVACNAINSAALLLRTAGTAAPHGASNSSGVVGRNLMLHNGSALIALTARANPVVFQKTLVVNDFYFGDRSFPWPMGQMQLLGKIPGARIKSRLARIPEFASNCVARHGMDFLALSEDLPDYGNRIFLDGQRIVVSMARNNLQAHRQLVRRIRDVLRRSGFSIILAKSMAGGGMSHQSGTVRMGRDPATSALDSYCRSWDHRNLFVVDASFFPASGAVNPGLTIAAMALRAADHMLEKQRAVPTEEQVTA